MTGVRKQTSKSRRGLASTCKDQVLFSHCDSNSCWRLDKVVAITLHIPTYPPDEWIKSPLYEIRTEAQFAMPWALDVPGASEGAIYNFDLGYFAHMCRIRHVHSKILTDTQKLPPEAIPQYMEGVRREIDQWSQNDKLYAYG